MNKLAALTAVTGPKDFLELSDFSREELDIMFDKAAAYKKAPRDYLDAFKGEVLAEIFDKRSVRTYGSFDAGFKRMGGSTTPFEYDKLAIGKKESLEHVAGTLSEYFTGIVIRVTEPEILHNLAYHATVPVFNGMTDDSHPVQWMADVMTMRERLGSAKGKTVVFAGDCDNNVAKTWIEGAAIEGYNLIMAGPEQDCANLKDVPSGVKIMHDLKAAARNADVIVTDVWTSMGQAEKDEVLYRPYQVNGGIMRLAKPSAIFMHCMPVSPCYTKEVTEEVLKSPNSAILQQAGNRMYAQNGVLLHCLR